MRGTLMTLKRQLGEAMLLMSRFGVPILLIAIWGFGIARVIGGDAGLDGVTVAGFCLGVLASLAGATNIIVSRLGTLALLIVVIWFGADIVRAEHVTASSSSASIRDRVLAVVSMSAVPLAIAIGILLQPSDLLRRAQRAVVWSAVVFGGLLLCSHVTFLVLAESRVTQFPSWMGEELQTAAVRFILSPVRYIQEDLAQWPTTALMFSPIAFVALSLWDRAAARRRRSRVIVSLGALTIVFGVAWIGSMCGRIIGVKATLDDINIALSSVFGVLLGVIAGCIIAWRWAFGMLSLDGRVRPFQPDGPQNQTNRLPEDVERAVQFFRERQG
mgnify:CR=1 FL=1